MYNFMFLILVIGFIFEFFLLKIKLFFIENFLKVFVIVKIFV